MATIASREVKREPKLKLTAARLEVVILAGMWCVALLGSEADVDGGLRLRDLALMLTFQSLVRHLYTWYLEWAFDAFPSARTQPVRKDDASRDTTGRRREELDEIEWHDRMTCLSNFALHVIAYYALPGLYPRGAEEAAHLSAGRLILHHYCLSFGMYWAHRNLHVQPWLWKQIHSKHHYARTPLARTTYMDHWADNFINAVISELCTQLLIPLPRHLLFISRIFRVCESLEKHSGVSGPLNLVHTAQSFLPFASMPHHHDWHHEGHKSSNYTFASLGGVWDVLFGTRHFGRSHLSAKQAATARDKKQIDQRRQGRHAESFWDRPAICPIPLLAFFAATVGVCLR